MRMKRLLSSNVLLRTSTSKTRWLRSVPAANLHLQPSHRQEFNCQGVGVGFGPKHRLSFNRQLSTNKSINIVTDCDHSNRIGNTENDTVAGGDSAALNQRGPTQQSDHEFNLLEQYEYLIQTEEITRDIHQMEALKELNRLREECIRYCENEKFDSDESSVSTIFTQLFSYTPSWANSSTTEDPSLPLGVYLHGGVGCGKTYCMNLFYNSLPSTVKKQKVHFHKFMLDIHKQMHLAKMKNLHGDDAIKFVIQSTLSKGKILCFDEFQVTDVADALILKRLFTDLIDNGTIIVATSNRPPRDLYKGGLQRHLFLPFIDLLEEKCAVVSMWESDMDYRLVQSSDEKRTGAQQVFFVDGDDDPPGSAKKSFCDLFKTLTKDSLIESLVLEVQGRRILVPKVSTQYNIASFSFYDLCGTAKGAADYLAIGERFHTIFIEDVPKLKHHEVNHIRRWITLIDALYENHVKVVIHAATYPEDMLEVDLNSVHDEVFAFDRTRSRMEEMRSEGYLRKRWIGSQL